MLLPYLFKKNHIFYGDMMGIIWRSRQRGPLHSGDGCLSKNCRLFNVVFCCSLQVRDFDFFDQLEGLLDYEVCLETKYGKQFPWINTPEIF